MGSPGKRPFLDIVKYLFVCLFVCLFLNKKSKKHEPALFSAKGRENHDPAGQWGV